MKLKREIERIKKALIGFDPSYFKIAFCDHEWEEVDIKIPEMPGFGTTGGTIKRITRCKKCILLKDSLDNPIRM